MSYYIIFDSLTGLEHSRMKSEPLDPSTISDSIAVVEVQENTFNDGKFYLIDNGSMIDIGRRPTAYHDFNHITRTWDINENTLSAQIKQRREELLYKTDRYDTLSAVNRYSKEELDAWLEYRQALRDMPEQAGYPISAKWPIPPSATEEEKIALLNTYAYELLI